MTDLIIPSLLPEAERREYEKKLARRRPRVLPETPIKEQSKMNLKLNFVLPKRETVVKIEANAEVIWSNGYQDSLQLKKIDESNGIPEQMPGPSGRDRELVVGIDFGTSCVKVVVGDRGAGKAYAVPFLDALGINAYLLPSRLFEEGGVFSLSGGMEVHRDLKLKFLADPTSNHLQESIVGFLALVIRRCRAWLFFAHADILVNRNILWKIVLGRAVDRPKNDRTGRLMADVLNAAWRVAGGIGIVGRTTCSRELSRLRTEKVVNGYEPEISVVPEFAAQIYGFLRSRQFDPRVKNFYLFVDVGAGTVDVSLFRVKLNEYGTWDFSLFTSIVAPNGVMNLHRARLDWWQKKLLNFKDVRGEKLSKQVNEIKLPTEQNHTLPETYLGYFKGVKVDLGDAPSPDDIFYMNRFLSQVRGQGIHRTVQSRMVGRIDLEHLPFFLCGGGARLPLYRDITTALDQPSEFKWLKAHRRELGVPSELDAPGLAQIDYDRLSVAFGLSFVDVGDVGIANAMPLVTQGSRGDWRSGYPDKDVC